MESNRKFESSAWSRFIKQWGLFPLMLAALLIGFVLSIFFHVKGNAWTHLLAGSVFFMLAGAGLIGVAERSAYRSGRFSFGYKLIPAEMKRHYRWGWGLLLAGTIFSVCLLSLHHQYLPTAQ